MIAPARGAFEQLRADYADQREWEATMKVDGACLCGHVHYEAEVDAKRVALCHCTDCQINSGCPMSWVVAVVDDRFQLTSGTLKTFVKTADSGRRRALGFCPECGTRIVSKPIDGEQGVISLRAGSLRQRDQLRPRAHIWASSAQPWVDELAALPRIDKQP
jgi:hypothetical protein